MPSNFRLKLSQFIFASFNRIGFKLVKSHDLHKTISEGSILYLTQIGGKRDKQTFIQAFLPEEKLLTFSCITPSHDSSGRSNSQNRTFIIKTTDIEEMLKPFLTEPVPVNPPKELPEITLKLEIEQ